MDRKEFLPELGIRESRGVFVVPRRVILEPESELRRLNFFFLQCSWFWRELNGRILGCEIIGSGSTIERLSWLDMHSLWRASNSAMKEVFSEIRSKIPIA
jgi:hypothetical protein